MFNFFQKNRPSLKDAIKIVLKGLQKNIISYEWFNVQSCNCGLIVQHLLNASSEEVSRRFDKSRKSVSDRDEMNWTELVQHKCSVTGLPLDGIIKTLFKRGFKPEDIVHLEYLSNKEILKRTDIDTKNEEYFTRKENLIKYLKAWLEILNEPVINAEEVSKHRAVYIDYKRILEEDLQQALQEERYEDATQLRDKLRIVNRSLDRIA